MQSLAVVRAGLAETAVLAEPIRPFDLECPLMSLPAVFRDHGGHGSLAGRLPGRGRRNSPRRNAPQFPTRRTRACAWDWPGRAIRATRRIARARRGWRPCCRCCAKRPAVKATWISLQKGDAAEQLAELPEDVFVWDGSSRETDLAETAALVAGLDLVITTDTCIAHLAGAMGSRCGYCCRTSPTGAGCRRLRPRPGTRRRGSSARASPGDWPEVLKRVARELWAFAYSAEPGRIELACALQPEKPRCTDKWEYLGMKMVAKSADFCP